LARGRGRQNILADRRIAEILPPKPLSMRSLVASRPGAATVAVNDFAASWGAATTG